jgi:branched-subunit amino acid aminotransferase/4-amino-4-deoxychorismate lyase
MIERTTTWTSWGNESVPAASGGLRYGDGVFVTLAVRSRVLLDARLQLGYLHDAARAIGLEPPETFGSPEGSADRLASIVSELDPGARDGVVRMQWFAGVSSRGFRKHSVQAEAIVDLSPAPAARRPAVVVLPDGRVPLPALFRHKTCSALANILCAREAGRLGVDAAVRVASGMLLETGSANVFWVRKSVLYTPADTLPIYPGSVRARIIECAPAVGLTVEQGEFGADDILVAESVILTNSARGLEYAGSVDGRSLGKPPESLRRLESEVRERRHEQGIRLAARGADAGS